MNVLVAYGSKHGATKGIAECIAERLRAEGQQAAARPVEAVDDLDGYLERADKLGGRTLAPPMDLPSGYGRIALFADPDGNTVGLWS